MLADDVLDLARINVEAAGDDHVLGAVDDAQEAAGIAHRDVAGVQPAAAEHLGVITVIPLGRQRGISFKVG